MVNSPKSYAIQAICLSALPWGLGLWTIWALVLAWKWKAKWYWLFWFTPWWFGIPQCAPSTEPSGQDILAVNVNAFTGNQAQLENALADMEADIVIVIEKRAEQIRGMTRVADDFDPPLHRASHHMAVFCRKQCKAWVSPQIGSDSMAMSFALVQPRQGVCVIGIHAPPPAPYDSTGTIPYILFLAKHIENGVLREDWQVCRKGDSVMVMGDMNSVPASRPYRLLLATGLTDFRGGTGVFGGSWPVGGGWPLVPFFRLDHLLATKDLPIDGVHSVRVPDSDHFGIRAWLRSD